MMRYFGTRNTDAANLLLYATTCGRRSSLDPGRRKVAGYQPDSCKPTHYSILVHMALAKTTLSLISKLKKGSLHVFSFL
jgi:hypothetical protein